MQDYATIESTSDTSMEAKMSPAFDIRPSPIAGQWYPGAANRLAADVDRYIQSATLPTLDGEVVAIIAPHAGHVYSGPVAGYSFAAIRGKNPDLVAVVSPSHYPYHQPVLTSAHAAYETPLGTIEVNQEACQKLNAAMQSELGIELSAVRRDREHSLEIELPFLQRSLAGRFTLLPVMLRDQSIPVAHGLGKALATVLRDQNALLVASTDLSHFYTQAQAEQLDGELLRRI